MKRLWLASSSPRRSDLLARVGLSFEIVRPNIDETPQPEEAPDRYVGRLSREKALAAYQQSNHAITNGLILSADTTVSDSDQILGKPDSDDHAATMLRQLRGRAHFVHTAVSLLDTATGEVLTQVVSTRVNMRPYTDEEIANYVASGDPIGKAGSYAIQNKIFHPAESCDGCYTNVVGLPLCTVCQMLTQHGIPITNPVTCSPHDLPCTFDK